MSLRPGARQRVSWNLQEDYLRRADSPGRCILLSPLLSFLTQDTHVLACEAGAPGQSPDGRDVNRLPSGFLCKRSDLWVCCTASQLCVHYATPPPRLLSPQTADPTPATHNDTGGEKERRSDVPEAVQQIKSEDAHPESVRLRITLLEECELCYIHCWVPSASSGVSIGPGTY